jgi:2-C-methyl-D-erythritol 4-phosphate cytidylyltransferase
MTTALIFAGGTGRRMNTRAKPKQFLELHGKPVIIYTLEHFEAHPEIDNIVVVCVESWIQRFKHMLRQYVFEKVSQIIPGGDGGDRSIYNGLRALDSKLESDDIVLIHDGVRPLINSELISEVIAKTKTHGNAITVEATTESVVRLNENRQIVEVPPREMMYVAKAPQSFKYGDIWGMYQRAKEDNLRFLDSAHLCSIYGINMNTVRSTPNNMKITSPTDYYLFRALFEAMENEQILGI